MRVSWDKIAWLPCLFFVINAFTYVCPRLGLFGPFGLTCSADILASLACLLARLIGIRNVRDSVGRIGWLGWRSSENCHRVPRVLLGKTHR